MKELMMIMANVMPMESLIETLGDDCKEYSLIPSEELKQKILIGAHMVCLKEAIELSGGVEQFNSKMDHIQRADKFFKPSLS